MKSLTKLLLAACAIVVQSSICRAAECGLLWQVGACDNNYAEFGIAGRHDLYEEQFGGGGMLEVGRGEPGKSWCYVHPGPDDTSWAGEGEHPFEVVFFLDQAPKGPFLLTVDLVDVSPTSPPALRLRVNDAIRAYDLQPGASEASLTDPSKGREQVVRMQVAGGFLHPGRNVVNITITKGSWALYDCISLAETESVTQAMEQLSLDPTYLFKQKPDGLKQIVYASMDLYLDQDRVRTVLASEKGWKAEQVFESVPSGHRDLEVEIPPIKHEQKAHLQVIVGDRTYEADGIIHPQRQWKIYMMPSAHLDYGYTHVQDKAIAVHRGNVERAIDWCAKYPTFGWILEGSMIAEDYFQNGSRPDDFVRLAKQGRLGVMGFFASELTGNCSGEGLSRTVDYYDFLKHKYGIESKCATQNDVPSMVGTVPMILRGHGIEYLAHGTNWVRAGQGWGINKTPYYWESPDGSKVLVWKVMGIYAEGLEVCGLDEGQDNLPDTTRRISRLVDEHLNHKDGYPYDAFLLHSAYMDNVASEEQLPRAIEMWNRNYAYPRVIASRGWEFFDYIERNFSDKIPTEKGDRGGFWEDGVGSSARETAANRHAERKLVTAEKLASVCDPRFQKTAAVELAEAWRNVTLYNEHTWGAYCSIDQPDSKETLDQWAVKQSFAAKAATASDELLAKAFDRFCAGLDAPKDSVVVFNPSGWPRTERVTFAGRNGSKHTLLADSVPGMGYRVFAIARSVPDASVPASGDTLENRYYKITFDRATGAVSSIFDKDLNRELVDASQYALNAYLYVSGGDRGSWNCPEGSKLTITGQTGASFKRVTMPGRQVMIVSTAVPNAKAYQSEIILHDDCKRIDFVNRIDKEETRAVEGCYFTFPFAFANPRVRLEIPDGVIRPDLDQARGACKNWF